MSWQDVRSPCSTSGRSEGQLSSKAGPCPVFEGLYRQIKPEQELVRLWHGSEQDFAAAFELGELVGEGGFAVVRRGRCPESGKDVAVKIVDRQRYGKQHTQNLDREIAILQQLDHPHLVRLHRVYLSPPRVYIVTELLTGGELLDALTVCGKYPEPDAARMMHQLLQAVEYLHSHGIAHRDLKLENLLLATPAPAAPLKIADLGLSKSFLEDPLRTICGSPQYVAPEVLCVGLLRASYGCAADLWSLGVVLFILLAGFSPFDDDSEARMFERIRAGRYSVEGPLWEGVSEPARDLVRRLLCVDPNRRLTAAQALQHPWICEKQRASHSPAPGRAHEGATSEAATRPKMSPRRPTIKGLDKLVLQSRSPNQSAPDSPRGSPRHDAPVSPGPGSPAKGKSSPRCRQGEHRDDKGGEFTGRLPASPRSPASSSPLSRGRDSSDAAHQARREVKRGGTPKALLAQIGKLVR